MYVYFLKGRTLSAFTVLVIEKEPNINYSIELLCQRKEKHELIQLTPRGRQILKYETNDTARATEINIRFLLTASLLP